MTGLAKKTLSLKLSTFNLDEQRVKRLNANCPQQEDAVSVCQWWQRLSQGSEPGKL